MPARTPLLLAGALTLWACSNPPIGVQLNLSQAAVTGSGCLASDQTSLLPGALVGQSGTLRLSVVNRNASGSDSFVCDATAQVPSQTINLDLGGVSGQDRVYAELFNNGGDLVASGMMPVTTATASAAGSGPKLQLFPVGAWSCPGVHLAAARAFHALTPLPTGQILITGGLTALGAGDSGQFSVISKVEVYDPQLGTVYALAEARGEVPRGRAFHQAAVLDQVNGLTRVLLYGGIADSPGSNTIVANGGFSDQLLRLAPTNPSFNSDSEILEIDLVHGTVVRPALNNASLYKPAAFPGGAGLAGGGLLAAGGYSPKVTASNLAPVEPIKPLTLVLPQPLVQNPVPVTSAPALPDWLVGPSVTPLPGGQALVVGTALPILTTDPAPRAVASVVTSLSGTPQLMTTDPLSGPATAYHTATALPATTSGGAPRVLLTGGFVANQFLLIQPPLLAANPVRVVSVPAGAALTVSTITPYAKGLDGSAYNPAGFEAATALGSGQRVLITGGTPYTDPNTMDLCPASDKSMNLRPLCVLSQSSLFDAGLNTLTAAPVLPVGRMGHGQVLLPSGAVLLTGGLVRPGSGVSTATADTLVYNPRAAQVQGDGEDPIAPLLKAAGLSRSGAGTARPCALVK